MPDYFCMAFWIHKYVSRLLVCMGEHYLVLRTGHREESALLLLLLFQHSSLCPYLALVAAGFPRSPRLMAILLIILQLKLHLRTSSYTGRNECYLTCKCYINKLTLLSFVLCIEQSRSYPFWSFVASGIELIWTLESSYIFLQKFSLSDCRGTQPSP